MDNRRKNFPGRGKKFGFTLVELLVAIGVLAIVAVLGWRGLDGIVRARLALTRDLEQTRGMQITFAQLQTDFTQIIDQFSAPEQAPLVLGKDRVIMLRTVLADDQPTRLEVVAYRVKEGVLTRRESVATRDLNELDRVWQAAIENTDSMPEVALQSGVNGIGMRMWAKDNTNWESTGADPNSTTSAVFSGLTGLELTLELAGREAPIVKAFVLGPV